MSGRGWMLQLFQRRFASASSSANKKLFKPRESNSKPRIDAQGLFKTYKPVSPGIRHLRRPINDHLHKGKPLRFLTEAKRSTGGRANTGRVTVRGRGGGHKRRLRIIDFQRDGDQGSEFQVVRIEYDPNRSAHLALIQKMHDGQAVKADFKYIIAPDGVRQGDRVKSWKRGLLSETDPASPQSVNGPEDADAASQIPDELKQALLRTSSLRPGNLLPLKNIPIGEPIHSIALKPDGPGILVRAAGTSASLVSIGEKYAHVKLASGEVRKIHKDCTAVIGTVSNKLWSSTKLGKAGRSRWMGRRPKVRGVAMNTVDHPHGGGRGKTKGNKQPRSETGVLAKGFRTRRPGPRGNTFVVKQRPRGKAD